MHLQILQFSPTKDTNLLALEQEYEKRLRPYLKLESLTLPASKSDQRAKAQEEEWKILEPKLDAHATLIVLDEGGIQLGSPEFAKRLEQERDFGPGKIQVLIGGSHGLHPKAIQAAKLHLSLSKMTFTHEMVRVFFKEQVYRAFMILAGKPYHK